MKNTKLIIIIIVISVIALIGLRMLLINLIEAILPETTYPGCPEMYQEITSLEIQIGSGQEAFQAFINYINHKGKELDIKYHDIDLKEISIITNNTLIKREAWIINDEYAIDKEGVIYSLLYCP